MADRRDDGGPPALNAARVAAIIRGKFPQLSAATVEYLGEGYDSTAFDVDGRWVFRFPKRDDVEQQLLLESRALPVLAKQSPLPLPAFCFLGRPSPAFPRHFGGYPKLAGVPAIGLDPAKAPFKTWAPVIGAFLSWLHAFPVDEATRLGVPRVDIVALMHEIRGDALEDLESVRRAAPDAPVDEWREYLASLPGELLSATPSVLVHGDLAAEHVLCDPNTMTLTGVIDWSEIAVQDRSVDLAALFHWGGRSFADAVLSHYDGPVDETVLRRAHYLAACRAAGDVTFGLTMNRREYVDAGLRALAGARFP